MEKHNVEVALDEIVDCYTFFESFVDLLTDKVSKKVGRDLDYFQITNYCTISCDEKSNTITMEVEGFEEDA